MIFHILNIVYNWFSKLASKITVKKILEWSALIIIALGIVAIATIILANKYCEVVSAGCHG